MESKITLYNSEFKRISSLQRLVNLNPQGFISLDLRESQVWKNSSKFFHEIKILEIHLPTPAVKFSNDAERFQIINSIRRAPGRAQIKRVIDLLLERRTTFTPEQINEACYVDVNANRAVFESLKNNPKKKKGAAACIRRFPEGMPVIDLQDAYPNVMEDLQTLKVERKFGCSNFDSREDIVYPNVPRVPFKVDDDWLTEKN